MKTINRRTASFLALALLSLSTELRADDTKIILSAGLGGASGEQLAGIVSAQVARGSTLFGARIASVSRFELFGASPTPSDTEYSILYGRYRAWKAGYTSLSAGLSVVSRLRRGGLLSVGRCFLCGNEYEKVVTRTAGIPFEARGVLGGKALGIGLGVFGNLHAEGSYVGLGMTVEIGSLR